MDKNKEGQTIPNPGSWILEGHREFGTSGIFPSVWKPGGKTKRGAWKGGIAGIGAGLERWECVPMDRCSAQHSRSAPGPPLRTQFPLPIKTSVCFKLVFPENRSHRGWGFFSLENSTVSKPTETGEGRDGTGNAGSQEKHGIRERCPLPAPAFSTSPTGPLLRMAEFSRLPVQGIIQLTWRNVN